MRKQDGRDCFADLLIEKRDVLFIQPIQHGFSIFVLLPDIKRHKIKTGNYRVDPAFLFSFTGISKSVKVVIKSPVIYRKVPFTNKIRALVATLRYPIFEQLTRLSNRLTFKADFEWPKKNMFILKDKILNKFALILCKFDKVAYLSENQIINIDYLFTRPVTEETISLVAFVVH